MLDVFINFLTEYQKVIDGNKGELAVENSFMSSTPGGMICLANAIGSISSMSIIQGKCWLNFTPSKSSERWARKVDARTESLNKSLSCPKLYCETTLAMISKRKAILETRPTRWKKQNRDQID